MKASPEPTLEELEAPLMMQAEARRAIRGLGAKYYCYALVDSRTRTPFYIGKGRRGRLFSHVREARSSLKVDSNLVKIERIREIVAAGGSVLYQILGAYRSEELAFQHERRSIAEKGSELTNLIDGRLTDRERAVILVGQLKTREQLASESWRTPDDLVFAERFRHELEEIAFGEPMPECYEVAITRYVHAAASQISRARECHA